MHVVSYSSATTDARSFAFMSHLCRIYVAFIGNIVVSRQSSVTEISVFPIDVDMSITVDR